MSGNHQSLLLLVPKRQKTILHAIVLRTELPDVIGTVQLLEQVIINDTARYLACIVVDLLSHSQRQGIEELQSLVHEKHFKLYALCHIF